MLEFDLGHPISTDYDVNCRIVPSVHACPHELRYPMRSMVDCDTQASLGARTAPVRALALVWASPTCCWPMHQHAAGPGPCTSMLLGLAHATVSLHQPVGSSDSPWTVPATSNLLSHVSSLSGLHLDCFWTHWILFIVLNLILGLL